MLIKADVLGVDDGLLSKEDAMELHEASCSTARSRRIRKERSRRREEELEVAANPRENIEA
jgi:hypothetical protein